MFRRIRNSIFWMYACLTASVLGLPDMATAQLGDDCPTDGPFFCLNRIVGLGSGVGIGRKVAIDGDIAFVGSNGGSTAHFLEAGVNGQILDSFVVPNSGMGYSVAISRSAAAAGAPDSNFVRIARLNRNSPNSPVVTTLNVADPTIDLIPTGNQFGFGHDVDVTDDFLVVGEPSETPIISNLFSGAAHFFDSRTGGTDGTVQNPNDEPNFSPSLDAFGSYVAIEQHSALNFEYAFAAVSAHLDDNQLGGVDAGRVYLYIVANIPNFEPILLDTFPREADKGLIRDTIPSGIEDLTGIQFGQDTEIDGRRLLVTYTGGAILYDLSKSGFPIINVFDHPVDQRFTFSQSGSLDGDTVAIGAPRSLFEVDADPYQGGFVFVYQQDNNDDWPLVQTIIDPSQLPPISGPETAEQWPSSIALDNGNLITGSFFDSEAGFYTGEAIIFREQ